MVCESVVRIVVLTGCYSLISMPGSNDGHESVYSWEWLRSWKGSFRPLIADLDASIR